MKKSELQQIIREEISNTLTTMADYGRAFVPAAATDALHSLTDYKLVEKMKNLKKLIKPNEYAAIKELYDALCSEIEKHKLTK
jgi:DNA-binding MurR/RpiR family transcriptional regulator